MNGGTLWGKTKTYVSNRYYPNLYAKENGSGINTTNVKTDGIKVSDNYYSTPTTETYSQAGANGLTITMTYYNRTMQSSYYDSEIFYNLIHNIGERYWLASRSVYNYPNYATFGLRFVTAANSFNGAHTYGSDNKSYNNYCRLRPVVSLKYNLKLGSGDGSKESPYQIVEQ